MGFSENLQFGMKKTWMFLLSIMFGVLVCTTCNAASGPVIPTPTPSATPQPALKDKVLPTPVAPGQTIIYDDLQMELSGAEMTGSYLTEYGSKREPPADAKFLWIHILLKNTGQHEQDLPTPEHFSVLYGPTEFKPSYGHRQDYADYTALKPIVYQGQEVDAWLRFELPADAELKDLQFAFLPESFQISVAFSPSEYPWGDHPIYLWTCAP
jgi:hypothetical protein